MAEPRPLVLEVKDLKKHFPIKKGLLRRTTGYVYAVDGVSLKIRASRPRWSASPAAASPRSAARSCGWSSRPPAASRSTVPTSRI